MKINIHIPIQGGLLALCKSINTEIAQGTRNDIDFSAGRHIPHITIYAGDIHEPELPVIFSLTDSFAKGERIFSLSARGIEYRGPDRVGNTYTFLMVEPENHILTLKRRLSAQILSQSMAGKWRFLEERPHVTVGYSRAIVPTRIEGRVPQPASVADCVEISISGPKGTVSSVMKRFSFIG